MKILLLSDVPPCDNYTGGLVLSAMVRFLPRGSISCFAVINPYLSPNVTQEFSNIPFEFHLKPNENWAWLPRGRLVRKASALVSYVGEQFIEKIVIPRLIDKAVKFGRAENVDRVWAVLQGQTTIRMAKAVAERLDVPLYSHVWDPFSWWAKANCLNGLTTRRVHALFNETIAGSCSVLAASEPMAALYRSQFNVRAIPVISSYPEGMGHIPDLGEDGAAPIVIGMAGQFYAATEWVQLVQALEASNWTVRGRRVRIVVMGPQLPPSFNDQQISFLGWKSQPDAAFLLSHCDVLYCPYPFDPAMKDVARFSFPSKLVLYLAAGRPILFHGPSYSAPAEYVRSRRCGLVADRVDASAIYNELERLLSDRNLYKKLADNAQSSFSDDFTLESMQAAFNRFIDAPLVEKEGELHLFSHASKDDIPPLRAKISTFQRSWSLARQVRSLAKALSSKYHQLRLQLKALLRRLALQIPRLRSLHHEIHSLYRLNADLRARIQVLEEERARLLSVAASGSEAMVPQIAAKREIVSSVRPTPHTAASVYPNARLLILISLAGSGSPDEDCTSGDAVIRTNQENVAYFKLQYRETEDATKQRSACEPGGRDRAASALTRVMLEQGTQRLVVSNENASLVVLAVQIASLVSAHVTVVGESLKQEDAKLFKDLDHVDFVTDIDLSSCP